MIDTSLDHRYYKGGGVDPADLEAAGPMSAADLKIN